MFDLDNIEKKEHYQIPENYFEELPGRVMQNIRHEQQRRKAVITSAVAAVACIAVAVGVFFTLHVPEKGLPSRKQNSRLPLLFPKRKHWRPLPPTITVKNWP